MSELNGSAAAGLVRDTDIVHEMQGAYLDYAMSVIVSRALPDVRDGLKPVHRRILYAMHHDLGLDHTKPHKKSARIVGEVLGKYHPHGDVAVYDAMVRMAQTFSLRYPLVDGQGNFGSVDGDGAAAMRYTEARLAELSQFMLADLEKETVEWHDNFDNTLSEPDILPATLPNLLINGASGIAVGMATNVPPHNLGEVVDALVYMIEHHDRVESITVDHLMQFIKGPDFPTGGIIYRYRDEKGEENLDVVAQGYSVGRSRLIIQAKAHFEEMSRGRSRIVVTELPYQTNKVALLERIAALVRDGKLEGITDLRDESDRSGMRVVVELTRSAEPKQVLADLFKYTPLQQTFGMQMLALVEGEPRTLSLKRMLQHFIQHRQEVIRRRSEHDLERAKQRAHILEGLLRALDALDEVIDTIRRSQNAETARNNLMRDFKFTQVQAQAILDMQLRRLAALERRRLQDEHKEVQKQIAYLEDLLANPEKVLGVIKDDLLHLKENYGDVRRTQIVERTKGTLTSTDLLPEQEVWVTAGRNGEVRRQDTAHLTSATLRQIGKQSEVGLLTANTRDYLYLFAKDGRCRRIALHELPYGGQPKHVAELTDYSRRDEMTAALALPRVAPDAAQGYLFLVTELGVVKRVALADFLSAAGGEPTVMNVDAKDRLRWVLHTHGGDEEVILVSSAGHSIRFQTDSVRSMGLAAGGVGGMKLKKGEQLVYAGIVEPEGELMTVTAHGFAKRTPLAQYSLQGRNGGGIVTHKLTERTGRLAAALVLGPEPPEYVAVLAQKGAPAVEDLAAIPQAGRSVQGKQVVERNANNAVTVLRAVRPPEAVAVAEAAPVVDRPPAPVAAAAPTNGAAHNGQAHTSAGEVAAADAPTGESPKDQPPSDETPNEPPEAGGGRKRGRGKKAAADGAPKPSQTDPPGTAPDDPDTEGPAGKARSNRTSASTGSTNSGSAKPASSRTSESRTSRSRTSGSSNRGDGATKSGTKGSRTKKGSGTQGSGSSGSRRGDKRTSRRAEDGETDGSDSAQSGRDPSPPTAPPPPRESRRKAETAPETTSGKTTGKTTGKKSDTQSGAKSGTQSGAPSGRGSGARAQDDSTSAPASGAGGKARRSRNRSRGQDADSTSGAGAETPGANAPPPKTDPSSEKNPDAKSSTSKEASTGKGKSSRKLQTVTTVRKPKRKQ